MTPHLLCCHVCSRTEKKAAAPSNQSAGAVALHRATHVPPPLLRLIFSVPRTHDHTWYYSPWFKKYFRGHSIMSPASKFPWSCPDCIHQYRQSHLSWLTLHTGVPTHLALWVKDRIFRGLWWHHCIGCLLEWHFFIFTLLLTLFHLVGSSTILQVLSVSHFLALVEDCASPKPNLTYTKSFLWTTEIGDVVVSFGTPAHDLLCSVVT